MALKLQTKNKASISTDLPKLTDQQWNMMGILGLIFFLMAILQLASFNDFKEWFVRIDLPQPTLWAVGLILAELWAAAGFFKLKLSPLFRMCIAGLALLVSGFWFIENVRLVSDGASGNLMSSGFFGGFLTQTPSWWTVLEASLLLFFVLYALTLFNDYFMANSSK